MDDEFFDNVSSEYFDSLITSLNLCPEYSTYVNENDEVIVSESWKDQEDGKVMANKLIKFRYELYTLILKTHRVKVLGSIMDIYIKQERYEDASSIRDLITHECETK